MKKQIGISIIIIGFIISVASPYAVVVIGIPTFILGVILLWISKTNKRTKLIWSLAPPILWLPITTLWLFMYNSIGKINAQKRDYYISENFKGQLTIIESKCGNLPIIIDDRMQFDIPENGVYLHNGELKSGHIDERVFKKNKDGTLTQLEDKYSPTPNNEKDTSGTEKIIWARFGSYGTRYNENGQESNVISRYIETNKIYSEKEQWKMKNNSDKIIDSLIVNCK